MATKPEGAPRRSSGRPPKMNADIVQNICASLEKGLSLRLAAERWGISRRTIYEWMERFADVSARVTRARAIGAEKLVDQALEGGKGSSMAGWMLERLYREDYGPPVKEKDQAEVKIIVEGGLPKRADHHDPDAP